MSLVKSGPLRRRVDNQPSWSPRLFSLFSDARLEYGAIDAQSSSPKKQLSLRDARVLAHMHSNRSLSFTVANVRDLSSAATLSIQLAGETNAETDAWRAAIQSVLDAVQGTAPLSQQQLQAPAPSPAALRWQAFHAAAKKWTVRPAPSRATLNIRLDKLVLGESTGVATAWDVLERALNDTLDQAVNQPCWQLTALDNGVRRFRHQTSGSSGGSGVSGTTTRHRATVAIAAPPAFVLHALLDAEQRGQWDAVTADIKVIDRIDACTDVALSTLRPFVNSASPTARFWAPREMLTLRSWSRNVPVASSSSSSASSSSSSSASSSSSSSAAGGSANATAATDSSNSSNSAAAAHPSSACVLIEVGVAYKDRECAAGAVRAAVNFVGYVARAAPYDENQTILTCVYDMHVGGRLSESAIAAAAAASSPAPALSFASLTRSLSGVAAANEALHAAFASRLAGLRDACAQAPSFLTGSVAPPKE